MRAIDRLNKLKEQIQQQTTIDRFLSLTNPKNISLMQSLVAWTCINSTFQGQKEVDANTTLDDLWVLNHLNTREFADTAGLSIREAINKLRQLRNLGLIFPDNTALSKALTIVKMYVKNKIENIDK